MQLEIVLPRQKELYETLHPEIAKPGPKTNCRQIGDNSAKQPADRFSKERAKKTGMSERKVQRLTRRGELMEIDENLARAELSPAQEISHFERRREIWKEIKRRETGEENFTTSLSDGRKAGPQHQKQFAAEFAGVRLRG